MRSQPASIRGREVEIHNSQSPVVTRVMRQALTHRLNNHDQAQGQPRLADGKGQVRV